MFHNLFEIYLSILFLLIGLLASGISPTKFLGVHIMNGWALSQMLLSGKEANLVVIVKQ